MALNPGLLPRDAHRFPPAPARSMVLVSGELLLTLIDKAHPDRDLTIEWGEPMRVPDYVDVYEPTFTEHYHAPESTNVDLPTPGDLAGLVSFLDASLAGTETRS